MGVALLIDAPPFRAASGSEPEVRHIPVSGNPIQRYCSLQVCRVPGNPNITKQEVIEEAAKLPTRNFKWATVSGDSRGRSMLFLHSRSFWWFLKRAIRWTLAPQFPRVSLIRIPMCSTVFEI